MGKYLIILATLLALAVPVWADDGDTASKSYTVSGSSMEPTLKPGDKVLVEEGYYKNNPVLRGDLVAIIFPSRNHPMVKRVAAVEGDRVEIKQGNLWINGIALNDENGSQDKLKVLAMQLANFKNRIPKGQLIVMGDNSTSSFDSGDFGIISERQLSGRVKQGKK
jgi:signal peptidase I